MKITIRAFADYREIIGKEMDLVLSEEKTIGELLAELGDRYPGLRREMFAPTGKLKEFINIFINGRNIAFLDDMATPLGDGDTIALFPPVAGG
ncbi:MAG TPA: MoaD/ThiS family protein [Syntrophales bacterium]|nr:MoaD/ThiS family protein [Syntrophales bacterium]